MQVIGRRTHGAIKTITKRNVSSVWLVTVAFTLVVAQVVQFIATAQNAAYAAGRLPENRISDIANTRHNFSAVTVPELPDSAIRDVQASSETGICVFCHTPHGAQASITPLWNRQLSTTAYNLYSSSSMDAAVSQPNGSSKLCLSCHDGTLAIGAVNVLNGSFTLQDPATADIEMTITGGGSTMPPGEGVTTGFTRNLGIDLSNDHPVSFRYDTNLSVADGDLRDPSQESHIGNRIGSATPIVPLEEDQVQCESCHDPHIRSTNRDENIKFLRLNRFQKVEPATASFDATNDIICLACHDKTGWIGSAHANEQVANEQYNLAAAKRHEFPQGTAVWQASCNSCHDSHTVQGSSRLLREGSDGDLTAGGVKLGGASASEETCYLCHSNDGNTLMNQGLNSEVPDIKSAFAARVHMPVVDFDQPAGTEIHDAGTSSEIQSGKDLLESRSQLGYGNLINRHAECSDCHNPHRVAKNRRFNDDPANPDAAGTHLHDSPHSNLASGVLKGSWGVEPIYVSDEFMVQPFDFDIKRGNPPVGGLETADQSYVTREYQICLKCHSNYSYVTPPFLDSFGGGTPAGTNGLTQYTDQAMEFQAPSAHQGGGTSLTPSGAYLTYSTNNHRSWHPVMNNTGRDKLTRAITGTGVFEFPFDNDTGNQTMYCSDCHGSNTSVNTVVPDGGENGKPWGPHGSDNDFLLKGKWDRYTGTPCNGVNCAPDPRADQQNDLCFKCHNRFVYAFDNGNFRNNGSGFSGPDGVNSHLQHLDLLGRVKCSWCHVAVPHGWKNKALLVNLNDVGPEGGLAPGTEVPLAVDSNGVSQPYDNAPYYMGAFNKIVNFATSGQWQVSDCGSASGQVGLQWMTTSCNNLP